MHRSQAYLWTLISLFILSCSTISVPPAGAAGVPKPEFDAVFVNARVSTLDSKLPKASNFAIKDGRIVFINVDEKTLPKKTKRIDLGGKTVLPGIHDSHIHAIDSGVDLLECPLYDAKTLESLIESLHVCSKKIQVKPKSEWLRGSGWGLTLFNGSNVPHKKILDQITSDRPVYLMNADGHSVWLNSKALHLSGINRSTKDPRDGKIIRDEKGEPTGVLIEGAMELVHQKMPKRSASLKMKGLKKSIELAHQFGITSFHDAYLNREFLEIYRALEKQGGLNIEVSGGLYADSNLPLSQITDLVQLRQEFESDRIRLKTIKVFMDGVLEDQTAALLEPYLGHENSPDPVARGSIQWDLDQLRELGKLAFKNQFNLHFHAIGDRAVREALNVVESARRESGKNILGHRISHLQLVDPSDWSRFKELGVFANFQPLWACRDVAITRFAEPFLGMARSKNIYPIGGIVSVGGELALGSDWAVTSLNPFEAVQTAITRQDIEETTDPNWTPDHRVTLEDALRGYTLGGARVENREDDFGSIEVGKLANFIVIDRDIFSIPVNEISKIRVLRTYQRGREVYRAAP